MRERPTKIDGIELKNKKRAHMQKSDNKSFTEEQLQPSPLKFQRQKTKKEESQRTNSNDMIETSNRPIKKQRTMGRNVSTEQDEVDTQGILKAYDTYDNTMSHQIPQLSQIYG